MTAPAIDRSKLYGVLHDVSTGAPIRREVRVLKVSIGIPVGPDVHVYIDAKKEWCVQVGRYDGNKRIGQDISKFTEKEKAIEFYRNARKTASKRGYPSKLPYFTFLRMGPDGTYIHDFDAIERHGSLPTDVGIMFLRNDPFEAAYQLWTASELKCEGDGINARRKPSMAQSDAEKKAAAEAEKRGERFFPIVEGCAERGCPFPEGDKPQCKTHGRLYFQLENSLRIGGTCVYDTTGKRSITQLFSCIEQFRALTHGPIAGILLRLVLRPYKTSFKDADGTVKPSLQYGVALEARSDNPVKLAMAIRGQADAYQIATAPKQIEAGQPETIDVAAEEIPANGTDEGQAAAMSGEFYGEFDSHDEGEDWAVPEEEAAAGNGQMVNEPQRLPKEPRQIAELKEWQAKLGEKNFWRILGLHGYDSLDNVPKSAMKHLIGVFEGELKNAARA